MGATRAAGAGCLPALAVFISSCLLFSPTKAAAQSTSTACVQSGIGVWGNYPFAAETSQFTVSYDATPSRTDMNGMVGFSWNAANSVTSLAAIVHFAATGVINVRNASSFSAQVAYPYTAGTRYHFQLVINPATEQYSVFVTPPGGAQVALASNYRFSSKQSSTSSLNNWAIYAKGGTETVCNMIVTATANPSAVPPTMTTQPSSQSIIAGQTATFSAAASGTAPLTYQWQKSGTAISGATSSSYTTPAETTSDNGAKFTLVVSNSAGTVTSAPATLTVSSPGTLTITSSSLSFGSVNVGATSTLSVTLTNAGGSSVTLASVTISGAGFNLQGISAGLVIAAGQTAALNVSFAPAATGSVAGSITIVSNASNSPTKISLSGTGTAVAYSAVLTWTASTSPVSGYNIYRSTSQSGPFTKLTPSLISGTTYSDSSVQAGQTYYYVATAVNSNDIESIFSNEVSATIP